MFLKQDRYKDNFNYPDGTLGEKEIKSEGGLMAAQNLNETKYVGMPQSAIASGPVEIVWPMEQTPPTTMRFNLTAPWAVIFRLSFALNEANFVYQKGVWSLTAFVVLISILSYGLTASWVINKLGVGHE